MGTMAAACSTAQPPVVLPYDATLHHTDCGCPQSWKRGQRSADLVDLLVHKAVLAFEQRKLVPTRLLRVAYMLPHHDITGLAWHQHNDLRKRLQQCCYANAGTC